MIESIYIYFYIYLRKPKHIYNSIYIMGFVRRGYMPLTRKARLVGSSLVITIPSQLALANDIQDGDLLEIIPTGLAEFKIKKIKK